MASALRMLVVGAATAIYVPLALLGFQFYTLVLSLKIAFCRERIRPGDTCPSYDLWHTVGVFAVALSALAIFVGGCYWVWLADQRSRAKSSD